MEECGSDNVASTTQWCVCLSRHWFSHLKKYYIFDRSTIGNLSELLSSSATNCAIRADIYTMLSVCFTVKMRSFKKTTEARAVVIDYNKLTNIGNSRLLCVIVGNMLAKSSYWLCATNQVVIYKYINQYGLKYNFIVATLLLSLRKTRFSLSIRFVRGILVFMNDLYKIWIKRVLRLLTFCLIMC